ncbi:hypothetical protein OK016_16210 [Vibrio chagasii]|nr:hypothetical protein [Vibrio chagasii]
MLKGKQVPLVKAVTNPGPFDNDNLDGQLRSRQVRRLPIPLLGHLIAVMTMRFLGSVQQYCNSDGPETNLSDTVRTYPNEPNLVVAKTARHTDFVVGERATFDIYINNRGIGYAQMMQRYRMAFQHLCSLIVGRLLCLTNIDKPISALRYC